jgi:intein/homing endonuclease
MPTAWTKLLDADCEVVGIGRHTVYPIFRNGSSSLRDAADIIYTNNQIKNCKNIQILLRDPAIRFVSGINEYCRQNALDVRRTWSLVEQEKVNDRHFCPQFVWLLHLFKFYKGKVTLLPFKDIKRITDIKRAELAWMPKIEVAPIKRFVDIDYELMTQLGQTVELGHIIRKYKNVLS